MMRSFEDSSITCTPGYSAEKRSVKILRRDSAGSVKSVLSTYTRIKITASMARVESVSIIVSVGINQIKYTKLRGSVNENFDKKIPRKNSGG